MTIKEAEEWIERLEAGNDDDLYRASSNLSIVLRLMLYSHLKAARIYRLKVEDYNNRDFEVDEIDDIYIRKHIRKYRLTSTDLLIRVSDRALRYKFSNLVDVYYGGGRRPEINDFYFAGIQKENKSMRRT